MPVCQTVLKLSLPMQTWALSDIPVKGLVVIGSAHLLAAAVILVTIKINCRTDTQSPGLCRLCPDQPNSWPCG